jgi:hypothetical protein
MMFNPSYDFDERPYSPGTLAAGGRQSRATRSAYEFGVQIGVPCFSYALLPGKVTDRGLLSYGSPTFIGVSIADDAAGTWDSFNGGQQAGPLYPENSNVSILTEGGPIWVVTSVAAAPGDPVYVAPTTSIAKFTNVQTGKRVGTYVTGGGSGARVQITLAAKP